MPDTLERLPILRDLGDDLDAAFREQERRETARRQRRLAGLVTAAAVAIAVLLAALPAGDETAPRSLRVLDAVAATAAKQPPTAPPSGKYAYLRARGVGPDTRNVTEWWVAADGSGRVRQRTHIDNDFERPTDDPDVRYLVRPGNDPGARWRRDGGGGWVRDVRFGSGGFERLYRLIAPGVLTLRASELPTDPDELGAFLRSELEAATRDGDPESGFIPGVAPSEQMLTVIDQLLAHPLATPAQRSALFRVAGTLEGIEVAQNTKDPSGRPATALWLANADPRIEVFFDPRTASALGRRHVYEPGGPRPITDSDVYTAPTTVGSIRARP
jgi:hypothetical protein